jgi:hypothetical protein
VIKPISSQTNIYCEQDARFRNGRGCVEKVKCLGLKFVVGEEAWRGPGRFEHCVKFECTSQRDTVEPNFAFESSNAFLI